MKVAVIEPIAPAQRTWGPPFFILAPSFCMPVAPSTCRIVLHASIGMRKTRKPAAAAEAATVFTAAGRSAVFGLASHRAIIPALAAVSPKRESGPWKRAGPRPR